MVTTYNKGDLRSFYNYMTSDRRFRYYVKHKKKAGGRSIEDRLTTVNDGDIDRWMKWEEEAKLEKRREKNK